MNFIKKITVIGLLLLLPAGFIVLSYAAGGLSGLSTLKFFIVSSGSMEPAVKTGSLIITAKTDSYKKGDIISFSPIRDTDSIVTHRIVDQDTTEEIGNSPAFLTQGDANNHPDTEKVTPDRITGKVLFSLPFVGYIADYIKTPYGFILMIIVPATIIVYEELKSIRKNITVALKEKNKWKKIQVFPAKKFGYKKLTVAWYIIISSLFVTSFTLSYFYNIETSESNSFVAGTWTIENSENNSDDELEPDTGLTVPESQKETLLDCSLYCENKGLIMFGCSKDGNACIEAGGNTGVVLEYCGEPDNYCCCKKP